MRRFRRRGLAKVAVEMLLAVTAYNLTRLYHARPSFVTPPGPRQNRSALRTHRPGRTERHGTEISIANKIVSCFHTDSNAPLKSKTKTFLIGKKLK